MKEQSEILIRVNKHRCGGKKENSVTDNKYVCVCIYRV